MACTFIELCISLDDWLWTREYGCRNVDIFANYPDEEFRAVSLRTLWDYNDIRQYYRVTQNSTGGNLGPVKMGTDEPLLLMANCGSWLAGAYACVSTQFDTSNCTLPLSMATDLLATLMNSISSMHRDLLDGTLNNAVYWYRDKGHNLLVNDFHAYVEILVTRSKDVQMGAMLTLMECNEVNSRYHFMENYWIYAAVADTPLKPLPNHMQNVADRVAVIFGPIEIPKEVTSRPDQIAHMLLFMNMQKTAKFVVDHGGKCDCLAGIKKLEARVAASEFPTYLSDVVEGCARAYRRPCLTYKQANGAVDIIEQYLRLLRGMQQASLKKDLGKIKECGFESRDLYFKWWQLELQGKLADYTMMMLGYVTFCFMFDHKTDKYVSDVEDIKKALGSIYVAPTA